MLVVESAIEGRVIRFDRMCKLVKRHGFFLCGNWNYDRGKFDTILWREEGETIYVRIPFTVVKGMLDHRNAELRFGTPFVIKHVVNLGLEKESEGLLTVAGFSQFQKPLDPDGKINDHDQWREIARQAIDPLLREVIDYSTQSDVGE